MSGIFNAEWVRDHFKSAQSKGWSLAALAGSLSKGNKQFTGWVGGRTWKTMTDDTALQRGAASLAEYCSQHGPPPGSGSDQITFLEARPDLRLHGTRSTHRQRKQPSEVLVVLHRTIAL
jgi:hypothetical protein